MSPDPNPVPTPAECVASAWRALHQANEHLPLSSQAVAFAESQAWSLLALAQVGQPSLKTGDWDTEANRMLAQRSLDDLRLMARSLPVSSEFVTEAKAGRRVPKFTPPPAPARRKPGPKPKPKTDPVPDVASESKDPVPDLVSDELKQLKQLEQYWAEREPPTAWAEEKHDD